MAIFLFADMERMGATVSKQTIQKVSNKTNEDAVELPPLYDAIDPDALNRLIDGMSHGEVSFTYAGHEVVVDSDEEVRLGDQPTSRSAPETARSDD